MGQFVFWSIFGLAINGLALLRGIALIADMSLFHSSLGVATAAISAVGIYASALIIKKDIEGFNLARRQVWAVAIAESVSIFVADSAPSSFRGGDCQER